MLFFMKMDVISLDKINNYVYNELSKNIGDFLGGTVGIFFTLTATIFLFITFKEQRQQFEITRSSEFYTRFETTYFNMLAMLERVQMSINKSISESSANSSLKNMSDYYNGFKADYGLDAIVDENIKTIHAALNQETLQSAEVLRAKQFYGDYFEKYVENSGCNLGYFYRYIYNIVKFVYSQDEFKYDSDKEKYLNLLQAQLSDEELALIFYDAISSYGENKDGNHLFHDMLDDTHFLENIKPEILLDRMHCYFYPKTPFKFMSWDERNSAKSIV